MSMLKFRKILRLRHEQEFVGAVDQRNIMEMN